MPSPRPAALPRIDLPARRRYRPLMGIAATVMNAATGEPIQKHVFGRMPFTGTAFHLASGERVTAQRVDVGTPAPGKFVTPVHVWVTPKG